MTREQDDYHTMIIVDDEYGIRQGLQQVDYESLHIKIVHVCENGLEALKAMAHTPVDILLTDIKMPLVDGLELIRKVSQSHPYTKKIVLSGYGDFEYAKKGMEYGVLDYLLKPLDFEEYYQILEKTTALLNQEREQLLRQANLERKAKLSAHLLRDKFLGELVGTTLSEEAIEVGSASAEVLLDEQAAYAVCLLRFQYYPQRPANSKDSDWSLIIFTLNNLLQDLWDEKGHGYHYVDPFTGQCSLIVNSGELLERITEENRKLEEELEGIVNALKRFRGLFKSYLHYVIGQLVDTATCIRRSYLNAELKFGEVQSDSSEISSEQPASQSVEIDVETAQANGKRIIQEVKHYIQHHYDRTITLDDVARHVHLNTSYLSYLFKEITGKKYIDYITEYRMKKARVLLAETNWKVYEVGEMVGYENPRYFTLLFKKLTGQSPQDYRNSNYNMHSKDG